MNCPHCRQGTPGRGALLPTLYEKPPAGGRLPAVPVPRAPGSGAALWRRCCWRRQPVPPGIACCRPSGCGRRYRSRFLPCFPGHPGQYQEADTGGYYFTPDGDAGDPDADAAEFEVEDGMLVRYNGSDATVRVPEGITAIGQAAFMGNETVAEVILPDTLESIYSLAFSGCTALSRIEIPASVSRIDSEAFGRCTSLEGHLVDPESPYYTVEDGILFTADRSALCDYPAGKEGASYAIPENVTMVMYWAFQGNPLS